MTGVENDMETDALCVVDTVYGAARGVQRDGICVWRGIPYAAPPVGALRFRKPQSPARWEGVLDATVFGAACPQTGRMKGRENVNHMSEDCLTLNIWSPADAVSDEKKRAVLFYVHGGSFTEGTGSDKEYESTDLARAGDVVVVTINYRIGVLGFLNFSFLDENFVPNRGMWDILAALRWVHENIEAFGGDAANVTLCGQSAGAICACFLSVADQIRGLIKRAILMSSVPTMLHTTEQAQDIARRFLDFMEITDAEALLALSAETLAGRQNEFAQASGLGAATFAPCIDDELIRQYPIPVARASQAPGIPMLIGTTREEMSFALKKNLANIVDINEMRRSGLNAEQKETIERISNVYKRYGKRAAANAMSDYVFRMPSIWFAEARSRNADTWMYRFDYETLGMRISGLHAFHSCDIPFLFGNFDVGHARYMMLLTPLKSRVRKVHKAFRDDFLTFVKVGTLPWEKCKGDDVSAKCYALPFVFEQAVPADIARTYDGSEFKRRCLAGESIVTR